MFGIVSSIETRGVKTKLWCLKILATKSGKGVNISFHKSIAAIQEWKEDSAHLRAQKYGREVVYSNYTIKICEAQRGYDFKRIDVKDRNY